MEAFIITAFILYLLNIGINLVQLGGSYPRVHKIEKGADYISLILTILLAIWAGYLIF